MGIETLFTNQSIYKAYEHAVCYTTDEARAICTNAHLAVAQSDIVIALMIIFISRIIQMALGMRWIAITDERIHNRVYTACVYIEIVGYIAFAARMFIPV
jgi:hypothetical protein